MPCYPALNQIGAREATGGTETSKYPEEEKSTEIARVAASESAPANPGACKRQALPPGGCGTRVQVLPTWERLQIHMVAERHGRAGRSG